MRLFAIAIFAATLTLSAEESSFTGKILKDKVRMRLEPTLDSPIIRELNKEDILVVTGEKDGFYSVKPPADVKAYVYRTYVLDGIVEGNHVNVRLAPDTESPIMTQLDSGASVTGKISDTSNKWLEILPPANVEFFVAKDYIEKTVAPMQTAAPLSDRETEIKQLLDASTIMGQIEIAKPFEEIALDDINKNLETIINDYSEFPTQVSSAKEVQQTLKEKYLAKKQAYEGIAISEQVALAEPINTTGMDPAKAHWLTAESKVIASWTEQTEGHSTAEFYAQEREKATTLRGVIEPYNRPVRNKPGDYVLLNKMSRLPVAFLYSTMLNLETYEEQEVTVKAVERPNNNFAFPAYYVLSVE